MQKVMLTTAIVFVALVIGCSKYESENNKAQDESLVQFVDSECPGGDDEDPLPTLRGTVTDTTTQDSLAGVCVKLYTPLDVLVAETGTDSDGHYYFNQVANGTYKLVFSKTGYLNKTIPVTVNSTPLFVHAQLVPEP